VGRYRSAIDSTKIKDFEVEATGHKPVIEEGKAPTKTSVGWTTGSRCSVCGKVLKARTQIPMLKEDSSGKLGGQKGSGSTGTGSGATGSGSGSSASAGSDSSKPKYSSEWVNGKWYNEDGTCTYTGELKWYSNSTGWWACNGRSNIEYRERLELEYYYIKHFSMQLDILCVFRTIAAVIKKDGAG
jgi:hypothetical protein